MFRRGPCEDTSPGADPLPNPSSPAESVDQVATPPIDSQNLETSLGQSTKSVRQPLSQIETPLTEPSQQLFETPLLQAGLDGPPLFPRRHRIHREPKIQFSDFTEDIQPLERESVPSEPGGLEIFLGWVIYS